MPFESVRNDFGDDVNGTWFNAQDEETPAVFLANVTVEWAAEFVRLSYGDVPIVVNRDDGVGIYVIDGFHGVRNATNDDVHGTWFNAQDEETPAVFLANMTVEWAAEFVRLSYGDAAVPIVVNRDDGVGIYVIEELGEGA